MKGAQLAMLLMALVIIGAGAFMSFVQGESIGAVFMGTGATIAAASVMIGAASKKKEIGDE